MVIRLAPELPFEELKEKIAEKFTESADFFKDAKVTLAFSGRELTEEQEEEILEIIDRCTKLRVMFIAAEESFTERTKDKKESPDELMHVGQFFRGTLRSGQVLESETSIVIVGDVEQGAQIIAKGNVIVLGRLQGTIYAGAGSNASAIAAALYMEPVQIKIGEYKRKGRSRRADHSMRPKVAHVEGGMICFDAIS